MNPSDPFPPRSPRTPEPSPPSAAPGPTDSMNGPLLRSEELLRGAKLVTIAHNGTLYRLQSTRQGKLILTK